MKKSLDIAKLPKIELHSHIEGTISPNFVWEKSKVNDIKLTYQSIDELYKAYNFEDLNNFLDFHYQNIKVLRTRQDFFDLTWNHLQELKKCNVIHAEMFFGPQEHLSRGVSLADMVYGINDAFAKARKELELSVCLNMNFAKERPIESALEIFNNCSDFFEQKMIAGIGLDSYETEDWPEKFSDLFKKAKQMGLNTTAHADEAKNSQGIFNLEKVFKFLPLDRIDYGLEIVNNNKSLNILKERNIHITLAPVPVKNLELWPDFATYPVRKLLDENVSFSINSDDPAYFKGNLNDNYQLIQDYFDLSLAEWRTINHNAINASFISESEKQKLIQLWDKIVTDANLI